MSELLDHDPIVALATAASPSALALIRLSGPGVIQLTEKWVGKPFKPRHATVAHLREGDEDIDQIVITAWKGPASYTGQDMIEVSCHGNLLIASRIVSLFIARGAREAAPGEFTRRAFLNGKLDLSQAEAVMDLVHAQTERSLRAARNLLGGKLGRKIEKLKSGLIDLLAHLEAHIDFPDEDISPETGELFHERMKETLVQIEALLGTADLGRKLREGARVVIVGAPNAGKSSLLNALAGQDRAIVSEHPGTTRDTVEAFLSLEGIPVVLIDTAGLRESADPVEKLGMDRTRLAVERADLILHLTDGSTHSTAVDPVSFPADIPLLRCLTKSDLPTLSTARGFRISAVTGEGIETLKTEMCRVLLGVGQGVASQEEIFINLRHEKLLREATESLKTAGAAYASKTPPELISVDLRAALASIGQIVGIATNEDVLDRLFSTFCIGK